MFIETSFTTIIDCTSIVAEISSRIFNLSKSEIQSLEKVLQRHLDRLIDSTYVFVEAPYADRVYRDSYYNYFATKFGNYSKQCIRLSFFDNQITESDFRNNVDKKFLQEHFLGFLVIRPTVPQFIGRSVISPYALKESDFRVCVTEVPVTINAIKLTAIGFPHSSQDAETITCAETTVWALMEYFGHRYSNYRPVLPSEIISILKSRSFERQWPSKGLAVDQISFALREFGFATRIYASQAHGADFFPLLSCYIESGIPIAVTISNQNGINHELLCIGRESIDPNDLSTVVPRTISLNGRNIHVIDNDRLARNFVFIDDNLPVYVKADLSQPAVNYPYSDWHQCQIEYFIVPLYGKVYLEAYEAKQLVENFLLVGPYPLPNDYNLFLRFYLTSSRSYKEYVATNATMQSELKTFILGLVMPKFIWVAELSTNELIKHSLADGVMILDATEANVLYNKPLVFAAYQNILLNFAAKFGNGQHGQAINVPITSFKVYENNLKSFSTTPSNS